MTMVQGLSDLRVVELGGGVSAPMAGKLLADLGATVVKVEPPGGDPARARGPFPAGRPDPEASGTFLYLNTNKRSVVLEPGTPEGSKALEGLIARSDLLIHNFSPREMAANGLDFERLAAINRRLVMCSITPFGLTGPYKDLAANELTLIHGGGWGWIIPGKSTPKERPPLKPFGQHVLVQAGLHAVVPALAACYAARETGTGEHIDISVQETVLFLLGRHFSIFTYTGETDKRTSPALYEPMNFYPCRDGHIYLICPEQAQWERFVTLMGNPEWASRERFPDREARKAHRDEVRAQVSEWTARHTVDELFHLCQKERVGAAPVFSYDKLVQQEHLEARGFYATQHHPDAGDVKMPGAPYLLKHAWWRVERPAPRLGEAAAELEGLFAGAMEPGRPSADAPAAGLPLRGIRVLDLSWVWAGPHCTQMLGFLGAEVLKVESSARADLTRRSLLQPEGIEVGLNTSAYFNQINQCKQSVGIDLSRPEGIALVKALAEKSNVMISNFGTGVLERLGLAPEEMQRLNPRMICAMISAFGQTGPLRYYTGYGPLISPLAGVSAQTGYAEDGLPRDVAMAYGDPNGGIYAAVAISAALFAQRHNGAAGQVIDISMWEAMLCTGFEGWMNHVLGNPPYPPMGNHDPVAAPHSVYSCKGDDAWVALAVTDDGQWQGLCRAIGRPEWAEDSNLRDAAGRKHHEAELDQTLATWCAEREGWEVARLLLAEGVPAFPVLDSRALADDPHLSARGCFTHFDHPVVGKRKLMGVPWQFTRAPNGLGSAAPLLGQHTDRVLAEVLGYDAAERKRLFEEKIVE